MIAHHHTLEAAEAHLLRLGFVPAPAIPRSWRGTGESFFIDRHGRCGTVTPSRCGGWLAGTLLADDPDSRTLTKLNPNMVGPENPAMLARARAWLARTGIA